MSDRTLTPTLFIATIPAADLSSTSQLRSTPFADSVMAERFEYPFPITQPLASPESYSPTSSLSAHSLADGSIVPPSSTGRGMSMSSFAAIPQGSPPTHSATLPSPTSAAVAASQSLNDTPFRGAISKKPAVYHRQPSSSQICTLAGTNPPMPPSLALKRRSLQLCTAASGVLRMEDGVKL